MASGNKTMKIIDVICSAAGYVFVAIALFVITIATIPFAILQKWGKK